MFPVARLFGHRSAFSQARLVATPTFGRCRFNSNVAAEETEAREPEKVKSILYRATEKRAAEKYRALLNSRGAKDTIDSEQDRFFIGRTVEEWMKPNSIPQYIVTDPSVKTKAELIIERFFQEEGTINKPTSAFFVNDYEDFRLRFWTNINMKKGNKLVSRRNVMKMLNYLNEATKCDPVVALTTAMERTQPLVRAVVSKAGNSALIIPLNRSKRMRSSVRYLVRAIPKRNSSHTPYYKRMGREVLKTLRGKSLALKQRSAIHSRVLLHSKSIRSDGRFHRLSSRHKIR